MALVLKLFSAYLFFVPRCVLNVAWLNLLEVVMVVLVTGVTLSSIYSLIYPMQQYCVGNAVANESGRISMLLSLSLALLDTQDTQGSTASNKSIKSDIYKQKVETHTVVYI